MSTRMTIVLALDADRAAFPRALGRPRTDGRWTFAIGRDTSKATKRKVEEAAGLQGPVLVVTVDDGLWAASVRARGAWLLDGSARDCRLVDDAHAARMEELHGDARAYARNVLGVKARDVPGGAFRDSTRQLLELQAQMLVAALTDAGIPFEPARLADVLAGRSTSGEERLSPVGDLPAFLEQLGLTQVFPGWREELAAEAERLRESARVLVAGIRAAMAGAAPEALSPDDGLPVAPLERWLSIAELCDPYARVQVAFRVGLGAGKVRELLPEAVEVDQEPWLAVEWVRDAMLPSRRVASAPSGTGIEVLAAVLYHAPAPTFWLHGVLRDGQLEVRAVHPSTTAGRLRDVVALLDAVACGEARLRDEAEADALDAALANYAPPPAVARNGMAVDAGDRGLLARLLFRIRHGAWLAGGANDGSP